jgi:BirA family biotin operon repressor/biotin-[acetyl-CoA-carboxylase] ligase
MVIGSKIIYHANVSSTNDLAAELINKGSAYEGIVISAAYQSGGRGQRNNTWISDPFMNLIMSVILMPESILPEQQFYISKIVSLAITDTLQNFSDQFSIKWPNDIYHGSDKIAGILIENIIVGDRITSSIAGIGLNINQKKFPASIPNPISLIQISKEKHNVQLILEEVCRNLQIRYSSLKDGNYAEIDNSYEGLLYHKDDEMEFRTADGTLKGKIKGVNKSGQLIIEPGEGANREFSFKEIEFL